MIRLSFPLLLTLLAACGTRTSDEQPAPADHCDACEDDGGSGGGNYTPLPGSDEEDEDDATTDDGTSGSGSGTDSGGTDSGTDTGSDDENTVIAKAWIYPNAVYDVSNANYGISTPSICMFDVVVDDVYPEGYGSCVATSSTNAYMADPSVEYVPGAALVFQAKWNDGIRDRYFAEYGGVVNAVELRIVLEFPDGAWQAYTITGEADAEGEAGWEANGDNTGGQVVLYSYTHTNNVNDR